ncbi:RNA polymerase sigma factor [Saccharomonospora xinjiangensis]|uniref:RNA polymerase sigma factor, sigma-70 family n=1 Tax=Saccharomonospora xinjiangensis XJ-54 TaxID=882086 RepID=I0UXG3_9PSEU|nr:sigma-70 family RNA polymerase sigma factor [Saccharomonospora xinjiangensis]EID52566.1 RNA polymerase sigma factor, sigma-70 family [Saccharomonospora xinjiangensis XJ-54]
MTDPIQNSVRTADAEDAEDRPDLSGPEPAPEFERLFDRHARPLHRYLARRARDVADDLVAETFLVALQTRHDYDPRRGTARSWLYGIATNLLRRHARQEVRGLRATARCQETEAVRTEGPENRVADRVDAQARARQLARALAELNPSDRDVLLLISWAEFDSAEVAEVLGIPVGTVRSRLHRVRRRLRIQDSTEHEGNKS